VNFGGGTNSTAELVGFWERGIRPDLIPFSDTGDEKPHTYEHLWRMQEWLESVGFPSITIVRWDRKVGENAGRFITISEQCETRREMPSKAYGFAGCTSKWKSQPVDTYVREWASDALGSGAKVTRALGFDADEPHRFGRARDTDEWAYRYPLVEWGWGREECRQAIARAGLEQPGKSACFMCPSSQPSEVISLRREYPVLLLRALDIERAAVQERAGRDTTIIGLGRSNFNWSDLLYACDGDDDAFGRLSRKAQRAALAYRRGQDVEDEDEDGEVCPGCWDG
jgi:hypothetical protein